MQQLTDWRSATAFALAVWTLAGCRPAEPRRPPNIVLVTIDSLRADHVHSYGYDRETTPNMDRLASEGALFELAIAESSWTIPTHATMFTGVGSNVHGMQHGYVRLSPQRRTLAQILKDAGYRTAGVFSGPYLHPVFGFDRGFDAYQNVIEQDDAVEAVSADASGRAAIDRLMQRNAASHRTLTSGAVTEEALDYLSSGGTQPFFLFLHYFDPHYDYAPPEQFWRRFDPKFKGRFTGENLIHNPRVRSDMPSWRLRHLIARYDGEILYTDLHLGHLIQALDRSGLRENTLLIVTSDHGEEFFEHGNRGHRHTLFDEVLKVPLIVRFPGRVPAGVRVRQLAHHIDIPSTILAAAGVEEGMPGRDLVEVVAGTLTSEPTLALSRLIRTPGENEWVSVRSAGYKYVSRRRGAITTELLFDLEADAFEKDPLIRRVTSRGAAEAALEIDTKDESAWAAFHLARKELVDRERVEAENRDIAVLEGSEARLPSEVADRLRALGYIQ